jgi:hypothetical protein
MTDEGPVGRGCGCVFLLAVGFWIGVAIWAGTWVGEFLRGLT